MRGWFRAWSTAYQRTGVIQYPIHLSLPRFNQELENEEGKWASSICKVGAAPRSTETIIIIKQLKRYGGEGGEKGERKNRFELGRQEMGCRVRARQRCSVFSQGPGGTKLQLG